MNNISFQMGIMAWPDGQRVIRYAFPSSLAELADGRLLCVYSGRPEDRNYLGTYGSFSEDDGQTWLEPQLFMGGDGKTACADPVIVVDGRRVMQFSTSHGHNDNTADLSRSWTWKITSEDSGHTWSSPVEVPEPHNYIAGRVTAGLKMPDGTLVMGYGWDEVVERGDDSGDEVDQHYRAGVMRSKDGGETWTPGGDICVNAEKEPKGHGCGGADEPALVLLADGSLYTLVRTGTGHLWESRSHDGGLTWDSPRPSQFVSHNCPAELLRLHGDPETVMVVFDYHPVFRAPLCCAVSTDGCRTWSKPKVIDAGGLSRYAAYPVACQTAKGTIVVAWCRATVELPVAIPCHVRFARFTQDWILEQD